MGLLCSRRRAVLGAGAAWQVVDLSPSLPQTRRSRACDPLTPSQVRYQAAPQPVAGPTCVGREQA